MHGLSCSCIYHPKHTFALIFFSFEHRTTERPHDQSTSYLSSDVLFTFAVYRLYLFAECVKFRNNQVVSEGLANEKYVDAYTSEKVTADFLTGVGGPLKGRAIGIFKLTSMQAVRGVKPPYLPPLDPTPPCI